MGITADRKDSTAYKPLFFIMALSHFSLCRACLARPGPSISTRHPRRHLVCPAITLMATLQLLADGIRSPGHLPTSQPAITLPRRPPPLLPHFPRQLPLDSFRVSQAIRAHIQPWVKQRQMGNLSMYKEVRLSGRRGWGG